jgi:cyclophilin family peptidyl-prolyl cis-trans isomerase
MSRPLLFFGASILSSATFQRRPPRLRALLTAACLLGPLLAQATVVRLYTNLGPIDLALMDSTAPISVQNFLAYTQNAAYDGTFVHRNVPGFVVQGGGYALQANGTAPHITTRSPIALEYSASRPNVRGSVSMARTSELNSATSEWFVNLVDNTSTLGPANGGGYAVFGQATAPSMVAVDAIAKLQTINAGGAFSTLPVVSSPVGTVKTENLVVVSSARALPKPPADADRAFDYLEATYWQYLKPPGSVSGTADAGGVTYYYRYYPSSNSYIGVSVKDSVVFYLVPAAGPDITRFAPLNEVLNQAAQAGYTAAAY